MQRIQQLCILVPCYNEDAIFTSTAHILGTLLEEMVENGIVTSDSFICFVNDGSTDNTWSLMQEAMRQSRVFRGINLSRNFGHQGALLAGLHTAKADMYVTIDADLQDDERKIPEMVQLYYEGSDIVYGCRVDRTTDTWFKRCSANLFYKLRAWMGCRTIPNHADFRLMSRRAVEALERFEEVNLFIRGLIPLLGFPSSKVFYARKARQEGESKYPMRKMVMLAWDGVVNFSESPLMLCIVFGVIGIGLCMGLIIWSITRWYQGATIPGWASLLMVICMFSSLQFFFLGIIGLYIGKVLRETKHRPVFIVQDDYTK